MPEQQQESMKVYELAKELGLDSFALLDKLKEINIEVKSHMSSLEAAQANAIREALKSEKKAKSAKTAVKKRSTSGAKKATATKAAAAKGEGTPAAKPARRKVIKRRASSDTDATEEVVAKPAAVKRKKTAAAPAAGEEPAAPAEQAPAEETVPEQISAAGPEPVTEAPAPETAEIAAEPVAEEEYSVPENAPGTKVIFRTPGGNNQRVVEKDELLEEFTSRRLKIVQQAPPADKQPTYRTPGGPDEQRKRPAGPAARTGTPAPQQQGNMFQPITSYVKKEEEARNKRGSGTANKLTPEEVRIADFRKREMVFQPKRKRLPPGKQVKKTEITEMAAHKKKIRIDEKIVVSEFAQRMGEKANTILGKLMQLGVMSGINQTIDFDTAALLAGEFGWEVENVGFNEEAVMQAPAEATAEENQQPRPPIITVMGHVDHGKTTLLDAIRNADVASGEAGGITQHIGAYSVTVEGKPITFLDTPGHEAFANMRSRGANLTDIVILVVAADDSIMPQTKEAIEHSQKAGVPIIVAANKMDRPDANIEKIKKDLSANNVLVEEWGGEVPLIPISAKEKTGLKELLEAVSLQAEMLELKANPDRLAEGVVLESRMEKGRGIVTDLLVNNGTLHSGDYMVVGTAYGRLRAMTNDRGQNIKEVKPGFPAEVIGLNEVPVAGDMFNVVKTEEDAKSIADNRRKKQLEEKAQASAPKPMSLEDLMSKIPDPNVKELNILVKADVFGSAEAIKQSIEKLPTDKVKAKVLQSGVGVITENDVLLAHAANAVIFGFNAKPDNKARDAAKREKVEIHYHNVIYHLLDEVRTTMENLLDPIRKETQIGKAEVKQVFTVSKLGTVAGSVVVDGKISRNSFARVTRGKDTVAEGKVVSLRRFKDDVSETIKGQECGIGVENFEKYAPGDVISVYHVDFVKQTL